MQFIPASQPAQAPSPEAWCFAFVERELLLIDAVPDGDAPALRPIGTSALDEAATARHYLGQLAGVDCWALALAEPLPGWRRAPLRAAMMVLDPTLSALAGFVEAGESLEECVHREVAEEVAVRVQDLRYYGSQSWPFPNSLMVAFTARWTGGEIVPQAGEIEHAQWFPLEALPGIPPRFSIAGHLIRDTVARFPPT